MDFNIGLNDKTLEAVTSLANKLGVTVSDIMSVYKAQLMVEMSKHLYASVWFLIISLAFGIFALVSYKKIEDSDNKCIAMAISLTVVLITALISMAEFKDYVVLSIQASNPEYYAIQKILEDIRIMK